MSFCGSNGLTSQPVAPAARPWPAVSARYLVLASALESCEGSLPGSWCSRSGGSSTSAPLSLRTEYFGFLSTEQRSRIRHEIRSLPLLDFTAREAAIVRMAKHYGVDRRYIVRSLMPRKVAAIRFPAEMAAV